jgi:hypothetical protein
MGGGEKSQRTLSTRKEEERTSTSEEFIVHPSPGLAARSVMKKDRVRNPFVDSMLPDLTI